MTSPPAGSLFPGQVPDTGRGMPLTQRCAEPPATALAQQKLSLPARARGLCWGPSGPRAEAGGGESEPPPHESSGKVPPLPRPAPQPGEPRLSAGYTRASSAPGTAGGAGQAGQGHRRQGRLAATRQRSVRCSRDPWEPPRRARRPPVAPPPSRVPALLRNWEGQR